MTACRETGCPGHYLDGYCDWCGMPEHPDPAPDADPMPSPTARPAPTTSAADPPDSANSVASQAPSSAGSAGWSATGSPVDPSRDEAADSPVESGLVPDRATVTPLGSARGAGVRRHVRPHRRVRRSGLGAGLTQVPPVEETDPMQAVLVDPVVPEERRICPSCGAPVGRSHDGSPGRTQGYCPQCRNPFSFTPKLTAGDLVAGQYEVAGPIAHGGLGWIYLARDRNVSDRWVVLKGLLNAGDEDAVAAAIAEQQFLAQVEHPQIVEVYNVVEHEGLAYTVMEYVGGVSLKQILKDRLMAKGEYDPLPVEHALAYVLGILPAFAYLHDHGLLYCDFKPDNLIHVVDGVKLIDLGGMREIDDLESPIYGTIGYQAPEVAETGPSIGSDIYTIGRTLVVLTTEFRGYQSRFVHSLPPLTQTPAFREHDPFYRLVAKCCAPDPADRFVSIEELRVQTLGVLRQVVADRPGGGVATQAPVSPSFEAPVVTGESLDWWELPGVKPDEQDPMNSWLRGLQESDPARRLDALRAAPEITPEVVLEMGRSALRAERGDLVAQASDSLLSHDPWDWRAVWLLGLDALRRGDGSDALESFRAVYAQLPGELAPRLAMARAFEQIGGAEALAAADASYTTCLRTDSAYIVAAAFGLARTRAARGDHAGAVQAIETVPATSGAYSRARWMRADLLTRAGGSVADLLEVLRGSAGIALEPRARAWLAVQVYERALAARVAGDDSEAQIDDKPADEARLRRSLESAYRDLARLTPDPGERYRLVDEANRIRPWSLI
ncbi:serine/threonine-protein kinase [Mobilicoccus massiliensis]|uniref:serine/threonine-protein kinase n=1 Tax=Mobilicoccus massiliensis TaxID=1522310 RepID=UPI00058DD588|nr:serine/threonine-protein kinase [Mobilicoccus massiliensis]